VIITFKTREYHELDHYTKYPPAKNAHVAIVHTMTANPPRRINNELRPHHHPQRSQHPAYLSLSQPRLYPRQSSPYQHKPTLPALPILHSIRQYPPIPSPKKEVYLAKAIAPTEHAPTTTSDDLKLENTTKVIKDKPQSSTTPTGTNGYV
jgi:hypothetical protein